MIVLGIDPGTVKMGYGLVSMTHNSYRVLTSGTFHAGGRNNISHRLAHLLQGLDTLVSDTLPHMIALEKSFYYKNARTAISLGEARGLALAIAGKYNIPLKEFAPTAIKQSICGSGRADKERMQKMIALLLGKHTVTDDNESDALGIALCCLYRENTRQKLTVRG